MSELEETWSKMLGAATENARASGRHDVADYLELRAMNDLIRRTSVTWLFDTLMQFAAEANRQNLPVSIERIERHSFQFRGANIVGSSVSFRYGVRCLTAEAGWTRTPADGFMRGGSLAYARLRHFGMPKASSELALFRGEAVPVWHFTREDAIREEVRSEHLRNEIDLLLSD